MSETENNGDTPTTLDETEKLAAIKLAEENRMDPNIIKAMREAPASSALIDAAARAKTPAEMMEQFANLDPAVIPPEMRAAVEQFKEQQEQKKLEDEALLKKAALAAEVGFAAFAAAVTTSNRAEAAEASKVQDTSKMTDAEKVIYFERLSQMTVDEFMAQSEAQQRQDVRNNKTEAINLRGKMNENINTLNEKVEAYFEEKYAHLPENERQDAIEKATDDWYKKRAQANGQEKEPPNLSEEDKLKWQQEQMTAYAERLRQIAEQEQDPKLRDILLKQAENVENDAKLANVTDNANRIEGKPEITREDAQTTITDAGRVNDLNKKLHANAASYSANLSQEQRAEVDATTKQTFATSDKTLSVDASTLKDSGTKMALNEARVDNLEAGKEAYQASVAAQTGVDAGLDFGNDTPSTVTTAQAEPPRLSQDLSQLQRAQQMMAEFDANGQKPANDAEGPKVATVKGPTVSNG